MNILYSLVVLKSYIWGEKTYFSWTSNKLYLYKNVLCNEIISFAYQMLLFRFDSNVTWLRSRMIKMKNRGDLKCFTCRHIIEIKYNHSYNPHKDIEIPCYLIDEMMMFLFLKIATTDIRSANTFKSIYPEITSDKICFKL